MQKQNFYKMSFSTFNQGVPVNGLFTAVYFSCIFCHLWLIFGTITTFWFLFDQTSILPHHSKCPGAKSSASFPVFFSSVYVSWFYCRCFTFRSVYVCVCVGGGSAWETVFRIFSFWLFKKTICFILKNWIFAFQLILELHSKTLLKSNFSKHLHKVSHLFSGYEIGKSWKTCKRYRKVVAKWLKLWRIIIIIYGFLWTHK